jgi:predicted phage-related endonuclease
VPQQYLIQVVHQMIVTGAQLADIAVLMEGDLLDSGRDTAGHSGRRVAQAWKAVRAALIAETKAQKLDQMVAGEVEEMYYI